MSSFIRDYVGKFCQQYRSVRFEDALIEAVKISVLVEPKFKPELGVLGVLEYLEQGIAENLILRASAWVA
jgi:hypothetical protein